MPTNASGENETEESSTIEDLEKEEYEDEDEDEDDDVVSFNIECNGRCIRNFIWYLKTAVQVSTILLVLGLATMLYLSQQKIDQMEAAGGAAGDDSVVGSSTSSNSIVQHVKNVKNHKHDKIAGDSQQAVEVATEAQEEWGAVHLNHHLDVDMLEMRPWESKALEGIQAINFTSMTQEEAKHLAVQSCNPPPHIPKKCCPGTYGGNLRPNEDRSDCHDKTMQAYHDVFVRAQQFEHATKEAKASQQQVVACDICQIVNLAIQLNLTIHMLGDASSVQVYNGLLCELHRRNYEVENRIGGNLHCTGECKKHAYRHKVIKITKSTERYDPMDRSGIVGSTELHFFYAQDVPSDNPEQEQQVIQQADILLLNFGLNWHHDNQTYHQTKIVDFFQDVQSYQKHERQLVLFREPMAHHFPVKGGDKAFYYDSRNEEIDSKCECLPLNEEESDIFLWRDQTVKRGAKQAYFSVVELDPKTGQYPPPSSRHTNEVLVMPFFEFTKPMFNMHPDVPVNYWHKPDCYTYCSSPALYMPIWRSLRLAMDRHYLG